MRFLGLILLLVSPFALAQYRCLDQGKVIITDRPCAGEASTNTVPMGNAPKVIGDAGNSAYSSPYGTWRGQVQFQVTAGGNVVQEAMSIVPLTLDIDPQGRVQGRSPENGCLFKGLASPGMSPTAINLDITLSSCRYGGFNRRLFGYLILSQAQKYAQFFLNGTNANPFGMANFDIKGTMRR